MMLYNTSHVLRKAIFSSNKAEPNRYEAALPNKLDEADELGSWAQLQTFENNGIHYFSGDDTGNLQPVALCGQAELKPFSKVFRFPEKRQDDNSDSNCESCKIAILEIRNE